MQKTSGSVRTWPRKAARRGDGTTLSRYRQCVCMRVTNLWLNSLSLSLPGGRSQVLCHVRTSGLNGFWSRRRGVRTRQTAGCAWLLSSSTGRYRRCACLPARPPARPPACHCLECAHSLLPVPTRLMHTHCTQAERRLRASIDSESGVSLASVGGGGSSSSAGTGGGGGGGGSTRSSVSLGTPPISPRRPIGGGAGGAITARDVPTTSSSGALAPDQATATEGAAEASSRRAGGTVGGGLAGARLVPRSPPDP